MSDLLSDFSDLSIKHEEELDVSVDYPSSLYRVIRKDEDPLAIVAKNPLATRTILSHVNCGSRRGYMSQYMSFTTSLTVAQTYSDRTGNRIVELVLNPDLISTFTVFVDLNSEENRDYYLGKAVCKNFAKASCEVIISSPQPLVTKLIRDPLHDPNNMSKTEL